MRRLSFSLLVLTLAPTLGTLPAQQAAVLDPPTIVASGSGDARVTPDRAIIMIGVQSRGASAAAASAANAAKQRAVIDTLVAMGIPRAQIATMHYNVHPEMRHDPKEMRERIIGYMVSNTVRVEIRKLDQVSGAIDASLAKGANQINSLNFYAENIDDPRRAALSHAVQRARADAEAMAKAAGGSLGELIELTTGPISPPVIQRRENVAMRMAVGAAADMSTPIEPGEELVRAYVTARWRFVTSR